MTSNPPLDEPFRRVIANESGGAGDENALHAARTFRQRVLPASGGTGGVSFRSSGTPGYDPLAATHCGYPITALNAKSNESEYRDDCDQRQQGLDACKRYSRGTGY